MIRKNEKYVSIPMVNVYSCDIQINLNIFILSYLNVKYLDVYCKVIFYL